MLDQDTVGGDVLRRWRNGHRRIVVGAHGRRSGFTIDLAEVRSLNIFLAFAQCITAAGRHTGRYAAEQVGTGIDATVVVGVHTATDVAVTAGRAAAELLGLGALLLAGAVGSD